MRSLWIGLGVALALPVLIGGCKEENKYVAPPPPKVTVATPVRQSVTPYLVINGSAVAYNQVDLVARVQGFLQEISYVDGAIVKKGDTLFTIEPLPYLTKLQQMQAAQTAAEAQAKQAQAEYGRQATLLRQDVTAQATLDTALAKRDATAADVLQAKANVETAAIDYTYTRVQAPFDGLVTAHQKSVGQLVGTSPTTLATIVQIEPIYVTFNVSDQDVLRIREGLAKRGLTKVDINKVPVEVALQGDTGFPHKGTLDYVSPLVDASTGTLPARGVLANADRALTPGFFVRVRVPMDAATEQLLVPETALGSNQAGRYLLVVNAGDVVEERAVVAGEVVNGMRVILSGLKAEDRVVVGGLQQAIPGDKVSPQVKTAGATPLTAR